MKNVFYKIALISSVLAMNVSTAHSAAAGRDGYLYCNCYKTDGGAYDLELYFTFGVQPPTSDVRTRALGSLVKGFRTQNECLELLYKHPTCNK